MAAAKSGGKPIKLKTFAVGDANGNDNLQPKTSQTSLENEVYRADINRLFETDKDKNILIAELYIAADVGGFVVREAGVFDEDGDLFAVGKYPATAKPKIEDGVARDELIQMALVHKNEGEIAIDIDPSIVMASQKFVDDKMIDHLADVNPHPQYCFKDDVFVSTQTLLVGTDRAYKSLQSAWDTLKGKHLNGNVLIKLDAGTHKTKTQITLDNAPSGGIVMIQGAGEKPEETIIKSDYAENYPILMLRFIENIMLSNLTIEGDGVEGKTGLYLHRSSLSTAPNSLHIKNVLAGISATMQSNLYCEGVNISGVGVGILAEYSSSVIADKAIITLVGQRYGNNAGSIGIGANNNASVKACNAVVTSAYYGFWAYYGGFITANYSKAQSCVVGLGASYSGTLIAQYSQSRNCTYGYYSQYHGTVFCDYSIAAQCTTSFYSGYCSYLRALATRNKIYYGRPPYYSPYNPQIPGNYGSWIYWS